MNESLMRFSEMNRREVIAGGAAFAGAAALPVSRANAQSEGLGSASELTARVQKFVGTLEERV